MTTATFSWTQPLCLECWIKREGERVPVRINESMREKETCCDCGEATHSGIYYRIDPKKAKHPTKTE